MIGAGNLRCAWSGGPRRAGVGSAHRAGRRRPGRLLQRDVRRLGWPRCIRSPAALTSTGASVSVSFWGYIAGWSFVVGKTASCAAMALTGRLLTCGRTGAHGGGGGRRGRTDRGELRPVSTKVRDAQPGSSSRLVLAVLAAVVRRRPRLRRRGTVSRLATRRRRQHPWASYKPRGLLFFRVRGVRPGSRTLGRGGARPGPHHPACDIPIAPRYHAGRLRGGGPSPVPE